MSLVRRTGSLQGTAALRRVWLFRLQPMQALRHRHRLPDAQARLFQTACSCNGRMEAAKGQEPLGHHSTPRPAEPPRMGGTARAVATSRNGLLPGVPAPPVVGTWETSPGLPAAARAL